MQVVAYLVLALSVLSNILLALLLVRSNRNSGRDNTDKIARLVQQTVEGETEVLADQLRTLQGEMARTTTASTRDLGTLLAESQRQSQENATSRLEAIDRAGAARQRAANDALLAQLTVLETRLKNLEDTNANRLEGVRSTLLQGMNAIRADNNKKLEEIRGTVDEKLESSLQKRVSESFRTVSSQLEQVYKGLGEMQSLAADVGSLKQVLSGVKTRGILGEVQLGAILKEILAPGQYAENVATVPDSTNRVEFAVRLPGQNGTVWLPIDAKFPGDSYAHLQNAQASGDPAAVAAARRQLETVIRQEAKDIHDKYIEVPYTTAFGILFLPFEGLYAEVVNSGLPEVLQREYKINVAGPSTMAALLNALQMGFRTLAIQKRSGEVWQVLGAVKTEFEKFGTGLRSMQRHLNQTGSDLEDLIGTRSRAISRKLESVQQLEPAEAADLLGLTEPLARDAAGQEPERTESPARLRRREDAKP
ncbi:MAG: DNA recombination protein RmuC [Gemmiger sp.]|uniref:DNA recombination protein RmuC n=1 Tax=Gemmiger sp. TaxID=2049027 RepID=UPI002E78BA9C|nr:DNA recombination protein RmuC [Gemmiger sp.]MEE0799690.1 DNA recombination protein RmuC [Gemmiger sp.]